MLDVKSLDAYKVVTRIPGRKPFLAVLKDGYITEYDISEEIASLLISLGVNTDETDKIEMEVINNEDQHFLLTFNRPGRAEISVINGLLVAHVYDGAVIDKDQEPLFCFDSTLEVNKNCKG